jgi:hypothetical protein
MRASILPLSVLSTARRPHIAGQRVQLEASCTSRAKASVWERLLATGLSEALIGYFRTVISFVTMFALPFL